MCAPCGGGKPEKRTWIDFAVACRICLQKTDLSLILDGMGIIADTLKAKKTLLEAGASEEVAEGIIEVVNGSDALVATKLDLDLFRKDMKVEIGDVLDEVGSLRSEMKADVEQMQNGIEKLEARIDAKFKKLRLGSKLRNSAFPILSSLRSLQEYWRR